MLPVAYYFVDFVVDDVDDLSFAVAAAAAAAVVEVYVPDSIVHTRPPAAFSLQRQLNLKHHHQYPCHEPPPPHYYHCCTAAALVVAAAAVAAAAVAAAAPLQPDNVPLPFPHDDTPIIPPNVDSSVQSNHHFHYYHPHHPPHYYSRQQMMMKMINTCSQDVDMPSMNYDTMVQLPRGVNCIPP